MGTRKCVVKSCGTSQRDGTLFVFPRDQDECEEWCSTLGVPFSTTRMGSRSGPCHKHFHPDDYKTTILRQLVKKNGQVPRPSLSHHEVEETPLSGKLCDADLNLNLKTQRPHSKALVQGEDSESEQDTNLSNKCYIKVMSFKNNSLVFPVNLDPLSLSSNPTTPPPIAAEEDGGTCGMCKKQVSILYSSGPLSNSKGAVNGNGDLIRWILELTSTSREEQTFFCSVCVGVVNYMFTLDKEIYKLKSELDRILEATRTRRGDISESQQHQDNFETASVKSEEDNDNALSDASFLLFPDAEIEIPQNEEEEKFHVDQGNNEVPEDDLNHHDHDHDDLVLTPPREDESSCVVIRTNDEEEEQKVSCMKRRAINTKTSLRKAKRRKPVFHCGSCEESFPLRIKYVHHLNETKHNPGTSLEQVIKPNLFSMRIVPSVPGPPWICPEVACSRSFKNVVNYRTHYKAHHSQEHCKFGCDVCNKKFWTRGAFLAHIDTLGHRMVVMKKEGLKELPPRKNKFICKHCGKELFSVGAYCYHLQTHNNGSFGELCEHCGKCFKTMLNLKQHIVRCASKKSEEKEREGMEAALLEPNSQPGTNSLSKTPSSTSTSSSFACEDCGRVFGKQTYLNVHVRDVHILKTRLPPPVVNNDPLNSLCCRHCGKTFNFVGNLRKHERTVHNPMEEKRRCQQCGEMFQSINAKVLHIRSVHEGMRNVACAQCGKLFPNYGTMKMHQREVHVSYEVPCPKCGKRFKIKSTMEIHLRTKCEPDPKWVSHLRDYSKRRYKELRETKPYKCDKCGDGIPEARMLRKHKERCAESEVTRGDC